MKKQKALNHIKSLMGYVPHSKIFEVFNDEDEIPQELIELSIQPIEPKEIVIYCNDKLADLIKDSIKTND